MSDKPENRILSVFRDFEIDIPKVAIAASGLLYTIGYLVQAITLRNYGIQRLESLKLQYVEVGLPFFVLFLLVTVMPVTCFLAHYRIRRKSSLPHYHLGAAGFLANTYNLLCLVVFFGLFTTTREWEAPVLGTSVPLSQALVVYVCISAFVLILMPLVERGIVRRARRVKAIYWAFVEPLRYGAVAFGLFLDVLVLLTFPWTQDLALHGLSFAASAIVFALTAFVIVFYIKKLGDAGSSHVVATVGITGLLILLYICINAYVFSVVRHIPMNRGGKMPITRSYLVCTTQELANLPIPKTSEGVSTVFGPAYVLEESEDYLYVASEGTGEWYREWATTYAVRKEAVAYIRNERIEQGGPRSPPRTGNPSRPRGSD